MASFANAVIYRVTNLVNGKSYIGITHKGIQHRWTQHKYHAKTNPKTYFHRAIRKYGDCNFNIEQIASCIGNWSEAERQVIAQYNPEYNMTNGGEITQGRRLSPESIAKIRANNTGKKRTIEQNLANSNRKKEQIFNNKEYREMLFSQLKVCRGNRELFEEKRMIGIRKAAKEGRMSRVLSEDRKNTQIANISTPEARAKMAASKRKPIECLTLNTIFDSLLDAAEATGIDFTGISKVCLGKRRSIYGLVFRYI